MSDYLKLLDGTVEDVTTGIATLSAADRAALLEAELAGKNRKGVVALLQPEGAADGDAEGGDRPANIEPASEVAPSGAPVQIVPDVDLSHPAVDDNPREGTTDVQNRIDFNDPTISGQEAVERNLANN